MTSGLTERDFPSPQSALVPFQFMTEASPISTDIWFMLEVPHFFRRSL